MGIYLNRGNELFLQAVNSEIYVDKSELISYTNRILRTQQKYVCISRPRRFGKSMAVDCLWRIIAGDVILKSYFRI